MLTFKNYIYCCSESEILAQNINHIHKIEKTAYDCCCGFFLYILYGFFSLICLKFIDETNVVYVNKFRNGKWTIGIF